MSGEYRLNQTKNDLNLSKSAEYFLSELDCSRYRTYRIDELLKMDGKELDSDVVHVGLRLDVDSRPKNALKVAKALHVRGLKGSFYFLTHPERHYDILDSEKIRTIGELDFEIGLHSDHFWINHLDAENKSPKSTVRDNIKQDIRRLAKASGTSVHGMFAHGHTEIDRTSNRNYDPYWEKDPKVFDLDYHDRTFDDFVAKYKVSTILDHLYVPDGWRFWPAYPQKALQRVPQGEIAIFLIHPQTLISNEFPDTSLNFLNKLFLLIRIRIRHQVIGAFLGERKSFRNFLIEKFKGMLN